MKPETADALANLQREFAQQLPERLQAIRQDLGALTPAAWDTGRARELHRQVHGLTGAAGTFGMESMSAVARELEQQLAALLHAGIPPTEADHQGLTARMERLEQLVRLRLAGDRQPLAPPEAPDAPTGGQPTDPYRVLLVDDEPLLLQAQSAVLQDAGMRVRTLSDPLRTLDEVDAFRPDVVVLDVYMPGATGPELASALRERDTELSLPILFLSAESDLDQQLAALSLGGDDFLVKPVRPAHLVAAVAARARRARQVGAIQRRLQTTLVELEREHRALGERVKEASCLNAVIRLLQDEDRSDGDVLQAVAEALPAGWKVPGDTCARIRFGGASHTTPGFEETAWRQSADIPGSAGGGDVVEVFRRRAAEAADGEAVFLDEEAELLRNIAIQIGQAMGRRSDRRALLAARDQAERANEAKSDFLSSMSHELRTPLNAILGFGQLMEHDGALPAEHQDNVAEIMKAGQHLLELINEVLDLAKVEAGRIELSLEAVDLWQVVSECQTLVQPLATARGIGLEVMAEGQPGLLADRTRLRQVLLNLLSNAIKYNRQGGRVWVQAEPRPGDRLRVWVNDSGAGISPAGLERLFQPFSRLDAENSAVEGTGIGLTITKKIVELMGGSVGVESQEGVGSRFWVELPLACESVAAGTQRPETDAPDGAGPEAQTGTVLYIEDNPVNIKLVSLLLQQQRRGRVRVVTAHTPGMGIELALAQRPDLILLDINMPEMDGYQVLQVLKADPGLRHIPVVALTANAMPRDIERGREAGFADYLTKPLEAQRLLQMVDRHLTGSASGNAKMAPSKGDGQ